MTAAISGFSARAPVCTSGVDTRLNYADTRSILSVLVVVDLRQTKGITIQQLADYVIVIGLAKVRPDVGPGVVPSILELFGGHPPPPQGMTTWDRALLYSLYHTRQEDKQQLQDIESGMVRRIAP